MTADSDSTPAPVAGENGDDVATAVRFADLDLPEAIRAALAEDGYETPSPIQAAIIPFLLQGRDVIGQAQTGTGKTAAFALPILAQLANDAAAGHEGDRSGKNNSGGKGPKALILAPTRELAIQVADAFAKYSRKMKKVHVLAVYGGADFRGQAIPLQRGVDVVVGTPGRVMDHMRRGTLDVSNVCTLVLDEADEMLRMGFVEDVEWVLSETPPGRQVALFSATMPHAIKKIAEKQLENPERITIEGGSKTADTVRQRYWRVEGVRKVEALCRLLAFEPVDAAIVFVRTRGATAELARALEDAGFPAAPLSGDVPQHQRERTIEALRRGRLKLVVATDVAARGIDVESISHVFNFDVPEDSEAYIHRIGRTGRAGRTGEAILFVENRQRRLLLNIERATGKPIEKMHLPTQADVHALQLERFGDQLKERLTRKTKPDGEIDDRPAKLRGFIEEVCEATGRDAADVAAFLVGPAMASVLGGTKATNASSPSSERSRPERSHASGNERFDRKDRPAPRRPIGGQGQMYRVAVGRADGVRAGHLVGAIANETGLDGQDINKIRIFDSYSTLELPAGMPGNVFDLLQRLTVLGKPLRIKPASPSPESHHAPAKRHPPKHQPIHHPPRSADSAKPQPKPKGKFKPKGQFSPPPGEAKPFKKFKPGAKPKPAASKPTQRTKPAGNPGSGVKPKSPGNKSSDSHSLSPAPFAGGGKKPIRPNKKY
ncbi:MAG: DEAD/DEAH box helicase, partial [Planctomycetota bacterium]